MNPSTILARAVVDGLLEAGVRHVVLAPGSRSAPLAYELQAADRAGRLTLHVRIDERAAGFLALGLAKVSRVPAAVVTTSGTAVANLHPAVLEAHHGLVPLLIVSADRPLELRGVGANQTTDQPGIFGPVTRHDAELDPLEGDPASWRRTVRAALEAARGAATSAGVVHEPPGPAHLDVAFREPLVPNLDDPPRAEWPTVRVAPVGESDRPGAARRRFPERTLVVIGDLPEPGQARRIAAWAGERGWPVIAEPFGTQPLGSAVIPHGPLLLATTWYAAHPPDQILVAGRVTLSRAVRRALTHDASRVTYLSSGPRWLGPSFATAHTIDLDEALLGLAQPVLGPQPDWAASWRAAGRAVAGAVADACLWGSGPALARAVAAALPVDSTLVVGSSNSVRDLELGVDWARIAPVHVVANRGLAGIDGVVSTAMGVALAGTTPAYALVGDLTFLHDFNALLIGPGEPRPDLSVVVANDDGGGIFTTLEPGEPRRSADFERVFGTPTGARIEDLARAYGLGYARAESSERLTAELAEPVVGVRVIEVPIDRGGHRRLRELLRARAEEATALLGDAVGHPPRPDRDYPERDLRV